METVEQQQKNSDLEKARIELALFKKKSEAEFERDKKRWQNRRRMSWIALGSICALTIYLFHFMDPVRIEALKGTMEWVYTLFTTMVLGYLGLATYDDIKKR